MIIYSQYSTPRVEYIFSTLFTALGMGDFKITTNVTLFKNAAGPKINYSSCRLQEDEIWIEPAMLLLENEVKEQEIVCFETNGYKAFFKTTSGDFPFDIFAASFYLITRYEEYLSNVNDLYGRYAHDNSLAFKEKFLQLPLVNIWLQSFKKLLTEKFPALILQPAAFAFLPTYDIDIAFSYLHKGMVRNFGGFIRSMWNSDWPVVKERMNVLFAKQKDPFDSYSWLNQLHETFQVKPLYFFLLAQYNKGYDKNILPHQPALKKLVQQLAQTYEVGIHPSWQSGDKPELLKLEVKKLEHITSKTITKSRQHYIRMKLPETYKRLIAAGITADYSMGYGSINGFRASYCLPYLWYDLKKEETTQLTIYPFCFMDANSFYEQRYSSNEALEEMQYYYDITKKVNGLFISIWHNHFLGTDKMFTGWKEVYKAMIERIKEDLEENDEIISPKS